MLSGLLHYRLVDGEGRRARLVDIAIDLSAPDYPPVAGFLFRRPSDHSLAQLPSSALRAFDQDRSRIEVESLLSASELGERDIERAVLLKRDVRDALVLDIERVTAQRVNDVALRQENQEIVVSAADLSPWAVLRWIARGLIRLPIPTHDLLDWKHVEFLRGDPRAAEWAGDVHRRVGRLRPAEIARMIDALPYLHAAELLTLTEDEVAANALEIMTTERQVQVFEELKPEFGARLLGFMAPDLAADLLGRLDADLAQGYLERMVGDAREQVLALLQYPADSAGGIMTNDVVRVSGHLTVREARLNLREPLAAPDFVYYVYVVDETGERKLLGVVTLRDLMVADDERLVRDIMLPDPVTIAPLEPAAAAARRVADNHLAALPVVDSQGELLGAVTFDAAMLQLAPLSWRNQAPRLFS